MMHNNCKYRSAGFMHIIKPQCHYFEDKSCITTSFTYSDGTKDILQFFTDDTIKCSEENCPILHPEKLRDFVIEENENE